MKWKRTAHFPQSVRIAEPGACVVRVTALGGE